ncbi:hypothetical protein KUH32_07705 [Thalassococcus sp. CAU 1522]|uniref:DUF6455 domain-containing protein n=1 Tax=Thalassococcus arenae TaxID=2851652 RepID=A0ABS6N6M0_9RHOB|nr:DUF6455 family protein [Thalassococcus arenae]MBV2359654.1 hypothetical protein [Thalassococcus arenae]
MRPILGDAERHFWMTRSVAKTMGVSLGDAILSRQLAPETYAEMVTKCRTCALVEACEEWLSKGPGPQVTAPPGCCNATVLDQLRRRQVQ